MNHQDIQFQDQEIWSDIGLDQENFRMSFMVSPIGMYIVQDHRLCLTNSKFQEITGYSEAELLTMNPLDIVIPEDREHVRINAIQMLKKQRNQPYQFRIIDKSGDIHWIMETVASIRYHNKRAALGNFMDVTEAEVLRQSFMYSPIGIYIFQNQRFVYTNPKFQQTSGYSEEELHAMHPLSLVFPEDRQYVRTAAVQMLKGIKKEPYQFRVMNKSGAIRWVMESVASIRFQGKRAILGHFIDITHNKEIEATLVESEKKYRTLFTLAREGIVIISYENGSILDSNREFERQTGYSLGQLREKKIWEIQPPELIQEAKEAFFRFRESCGGIIMWKLFQAKEGKILPVEIIAQRMTMEGQDVILCMVRDISEREAMLRALTLASEEWRKSFDAIEDAMLLINPDFRILRANISASRLVKRDPRSIIGEQCYKLFHGTDAPPDYCPHLKAQLQGVHHEVEKDEAFLGRTLHFSSSPIKDDYGVITHSVEIISDVTQRRQQELESIQLSKALANSFQGITESLSDLAETRDPYTAGHSRHVAELSVMAGKEIGLDDESLQGLRTCAVLHDIGKVIIPAAILNKPGRLSEHEWGMIRQHPTTAFETLKHIPFPWPVAEVVYQHHERLDGSGYPRGLCWDQIHPWARIIAVADVVDAMTSHRPYRPRMPRQNAIDELERGMGTLYDRKITEALIRVLRIDDSRILIIDEDPEVLRVLCDSLSSDGLEPIGFREVRSALEAFKKKPFPLVLTELYALEIDGILLIKKIKEINPDTEIIVMSNFVGKEEMLKAIRAGASDFMEKPLDILILRKSVNRALQRYSGKRIDK